jgi:hypothetical protein
MAQLRALAAASKAETSSTASLDSRALAVFLEDKTRTKKAIADILGLNHTQSLSPERCPELDKAMKTWEVAQRPEKPKGTKDKHGNLEARAPDDDT